MQSSRVYPSFFKLLRQRAPKLSSVDYLGVRNIFQDEIVGLEGMDSMNAYLGGSASSFVVQEALSLAALGERLAWESSYVHVDSAIRFDVGGGLTRHQHGFLGGRSCPR